MKNHIAATNIHKILINLYKILTLYTKNITSQNLQWLVFF